VRSRMQGADGLPVTLTVTAGNYRPPAGCFSQAHGTVADSGWHVLRVSANISAAGRADYELSVTYFGTGRL
jgi:hypothetical protein